MIISSFQCTQNGLIIINFANSQAIHEPFLDFQKAVHESDKKNLKGAHPTMR